MKKTVTMVAVMSLALGFSFAAARAFKLNVPKIPGVPSAPGTGGSNAPASVGGGDPSYSFLKTCNQVEKDLEEIDDKASVWQRVKSNFSGGECEEYHKSSKIASGMSEYYSIHCGRHFAADNMCVGLTSVCTVEPKRKNCITNSERFNMNSNPKCPKPINR